MKLTHPPNNLVNIENGIYYMDESQTIAYKNDSELVVFKVNEISNLSLKVKTKMSIGNGLELMLKNGAVIRMSDKYLDTIVKLF